MCGTVTAADVEPAYLYIREVCGNVGGAVEWELLRFLDLNLLQVYEEECRAGS